jgi:hypothetical protein
MPSGADPGRRLPVLDRGKKRSGRVLLAQEHEHGEASDRRDDDRCAPLARRLAGDPNFTRSASYFCSTVTLRSCR